MLENKKPVCSIKRFDGLTKQFSKIVRRVIHDNITESNYDIFMLYIEYYLNNQIDILLNTFKSNMHKTKSGQMIKLFSSDHTFWLTYTFENDEFKRTSKSTNIVFRLFVKFEGGKKKRLVRWVVPIVPIKIDENGTN